MPSSCGCVSLAMLMVVVRSENQGKVAQPNVAVRLLCVRSKYGLLVHHMSKNVTEKSKTISDKLSRPLHVDDNVSVNALRTAKCSVLLIILQFSSQMLNC